MRGDENIENIAASAEPPHLWVRAQGERHRPTSVSGCACVCVIPVAMYFITHIQTMHPKKKDTLCDIRSTYIIARGLMNAENPVGPWAIGVSTGFLLRCIQGAGLSMKKFSQGGATNPHPFVAKCVCVCVFFSMFSLLLLCRENVMVFGGRLVFRHI